MKKRTDKRTTVSLAQVVWDWAVEMMEARGYNDNFSAYIAELIRRDKDRQREIESGFPKSSNSTSYPSTPDRGVLVEDKPVPPKKKKAA